MRRSLLLVLSTTAALTFFGTTSNAAGPASAHLARGSQGMFWFMHISDLHTSCEWDATDEMKNQAFAFGPAVQVIKPWFLVATGDLVDASPNGIPTLGQSQAEWDEYKASYTSAGLVPDFYFDLPGNHDGYGDKGYSYYLANSLQGSTNHATYLSWVVDTPLGSYLFFGFSSAGDGSGPISEDPKFLPEQVTALQDAIAQNSSAELVFVMAHHRITQPSNSEPVIATLRDIGGGFYVHGHVHEYDEYTDGDPSIVVNEIDSLGQKEQNNIGVGVVDHNAFIYRATSTGAAWPFVIITAPVSKTLRNGSTNPYAYTVCKDRTDNPVRALVFGDGPVTDVAVQIGSAPAATMHPAGQPGSVWVADVDTTSLSAGPQDVTVTATVGGKIGFHKITADFVDGPCDALPEDPPPDGGADGGLEAGEDGAAGAAGAGGSASGGSGGAGTGGGASGGSGGVSPDAGGAGAAGDPGAPEAGATTSDDGGCSCRSAGGSDAGGVWAAVLAGLAIGLGRRKRG